MGSLTIELFLRELCFWFVFAPGAFSGWADHCVLLSGGQCLLMVRELFLLEMWWSNSTAHVNHSQTFCVLQSNFTRPMWLEAMAEIRLTPQAFIERNQLRGASSRFQWSWSGGGGVVADCAVWHSKKSTATRMQPHGDGRRKTRHIRAEGQGDRRSHPSVMIS